MSQQQQYSTPATFVNVKRVRTGDKDSKGRDKTVLTFGLQERDGVTSNTLQDLVTALLPYAEAGKQVNMSIHIEEKQGPTGKFPSAFVKITEMIPKAQQAGKTQYVPKTQNAAAVAANVRSQFNKG